MNEIADKPQVTQAVVLVGFMGAGKTTVGQALARQLGWSFEDLDDRIELRERCSIPEIFNRLGESGFRRAEHDAVVEALAELVPGRVLALGGGAFVQAENAALIAQFPVVFLDAPAEELWRRCQGDSSQRPLRQGFDQFCRLCEIRRPYYLRASLRVETSGKDIETIAAEVCRALNLR
jgi:shikimate kinase